MLWMKKSLILIVIMSCAVAIYPAFADSETALRAESKLKQVALFKNGLGFFICEVTVPDKKDLFSIVPAAAASHGTFWVSYPPKLKVESITAKEVKYEEPAKAVTISELLMANVGRKVSLAVDNKQIDGVIKYFAEDRESPTPSSYAPGRAEQPTPGYRAPDFMQSRLVIIETEQGEVAIDPLNVKRVEFLEGKVEKTFTRKSKSMQLDIGLGTPAGGQKLTVSYLAKGITWAPSYMVDISDENEALLSAQAAVINEVCDLDGVTLQLVTGFPHLQFADVVSPLALKENLAQFLQALVRGQSERARADVTSQVVMYQSMEGYRGGYGGYPEAIMPAYGAAEAGKVAEDLFLYPVEKAQLKKGEVGYYPLFTESVPCKHIYQWNIPDYVNEQERYVYDRRREQQREPEEEVWHCLRLENTTKVPWTTAPAETIKEGLILGQDTLNYTPVKGETTLRITRAVSVKAEQLELETDRKRDAAQLYGYHYDLITVEGKLSVTNFQDKAIILEIVKTLSGEVKQTQPEAKIKTLAKGLLRMNAVRNLTWTTELKAGEQKELSYIYEVYVRR